MAAGKAFERVVNRVRVTRADGAVVVDLLQSGAELGPIVWYNGLAHGEEVRTKATNQPFEEDLEDSCSDQRVEKANDGVVDVPKGACKEEISVADELAS